MSYVVLDTETTGLPDTIGWGKFYPANKITKYDNSRMIQLAWKIFDAEDNEISEQNYYIRPDEFKVLNSSFHGITEDFLYKEGLPIKDVVEIFIKDIQNHKAKYIVGHNISFDWNIILSELYRYKMKNEICFFVKLSTFCTMLMSQDVLKIKGKYSGSGRGYKYPSLQELYHYYYRIDIKNQHNAKYDVEACADCYIKLKKLYEVEV
jgi:DNA polymerase-3 subunit alpha